MPSSSSITSSSRTPILDHGSLKTRVVRSFLVDFSHEISTYVLSFFLSFFANGHCENGFYIASSLNDQLPHPLRSKALHIPPRTKIGFPIAHRLPMRVSHLFFLMLDSRSAVPIRQLIQSGLIQPLLVTYMMGSFLDLAARQLSYYGMLRPSLVYAHYITSWTSLYSFRSGTLGNYPLDFRTVSLHNNKAVEKATRRKSSFRLRYDFNNMSLYSDYMLTRSRWSLF